MNDTSHGNKTMITKKTIKVEIDYRESLLNEAVKQYQKNTKTNILFCIKNLICGDIQIMDENFTWILEKKSWNDLYQSILDGRYREQRARLLSCRNENVKIAYIIDICKEEDLCKENKERCLEVVYRLLFAYDIPVLFKKGNEEIIEWIALVCKYDNLSPFMKKRNERQDMVENIRICKELKKKDVLNPFTLLLCSIQCIKGVSYTMAEKIAQEFQSMQGWMDWVQEASRQNDYQRLSGLTYSTKKNPEKKIGDKVCKMIISYFIPMNM